ncbi:DUF2158 domain-containing protein [Sphingomonas sanguinis]|uniref:DUF2158 domain-containing protein n=1 Tax=Sphingomonas sanguinis TaxID=33051 RepID=UPI001C58E0B0|nr:DUF2158 domain-containing protein [Sphingomonas sanguinis]QXT36860.1 DUF2158 domain-containing protein [Sphingomonas sanguinis]
MANIDFKAGDLVELISGSPIMTVEQSVFMSDGLKYRCTWFAGAKHNRELFVGAALRPATPKS